MSKLTKDQLKVQLVSHGIKLPSPSAKKDEYLKLYKKHIVPLRRGEFSSDEEDFNHISFESNNTMTTLIINGINITALDDDDLFARLKGFGATVGPIVESTRKVYERKLFVLMGGELPDSPTFNGDMDEDEYSDNEEEIVEEPVNTRRSARTETTTTSYRSSAISPSAMSSAIRSPSAMSSPQVSNFTDIRKRVILTPGNEERDGIIFDPDLHTPSPRRSLRTVTGSTTEYTTTRTFTGLSNDTSIVGSVEKSKLQVPAGGVGESIDVIDTGKSSKCGVCLRMTVKLVFLALILALALYFYQTTSSESPFKAVEQLARQALEAAAGEEAEDVAVKPGDPIPPPPPPSKEEARVFPQDKQ